MQKHWPLDLSKVELIAGTLFSSSLVSAIAANVVSIGQGGTLGSQEHLTTLGGLDANYLGMLGRLYYDTSMVFPLLDQQSEASSHLQDMHRIAREVYDFRIRTSVMCASALAHAKVLDGRFVNRPLSTCMSEAWALASSYKPIAAHAEWYVLNKPEPKSAEHAGSMVIQWLLSTPFPHDERSEEPQFINCGDYVRRLMLSHSEIELTAEERVPWEVKF